MIPRAVAIVPAAGKSERFGSMKLLADLGGQPLIARTLGTLINAGVPRIVVVVAPVPFGMIDLFQDARVELATNPDPSRGMFSTIQAGLAFAAEDDLTLVLPADMPFVAADTVRQVIDACARTNVPVAAAFRGRAGHPLVLPPRLREGLLGARADGNLKDTLVALGATPIPFDVDDEGVVRDVDRREDLGI